MKRCKNIKCHNFVKEHSGEKLEGRPSEYCENCQQRFQNVNWKNVYRMKHEKARVGNAKQDSEIMSFLRKKRDKEDKKYQ